MSNGISPYGFNLGNVLMQAEQIKAARQANTLAQQQMQQRAQFQPLLQNYLATQSPEAAQALIAQDPQAAAQIFGAQTAQTGVAAAQMQLQPARLSIPSLPNACFLQRSPALLRA
jgi:hypothetical protein